MTTIIPVNVGTIPDDGTGDLGRDGFIKINTNIDNLNTDKVEDAPSDGNQYARKDGVWSVVVSGLTKAMTFEVTSAFISGEIIDITTGNGSISGTSIRTVGDTGAIDSIGSNTSEFNLNASLSVTDNKTEGLKGSDVIWDSATTFHFTRDVGIGEWFKILDGENTGALGDITVSGLTNTGDSDLQGNVTIGSTLDVTGQTNLGDTDISGPLDVIGDTTVNNIEITGDITKTGSSIGTEVIFVDDSGAGSTINLPTAVGLLNVRKTYIRTDISLNFTTILPNGSELINNVSSFTLGKGESVTLISDDSNWFII